MAAAKTTEEWKSRTIYQLLTDRFARTDGSTDKCNDLHNYCGGSFKGI
jgi:alpha-amylase